MATRKKKIIESADVAEMVNVTANAWPKISKGSHLTVKTFEDGRTELIWDDDALLSEVKNAILKHESTISVTTVKKTRKKKSA